ncbi:hypothetical protein BDF22DRAFT_741473 [Syncephalis plumigaleata]|nr:hypothetical protein BDF22DRAFT_741473 [Syncephalis plumigaleata]
MTNDTLPGAVELEPTDTLPADTSILSSDDEAAGAQFLSSDDATDPIRLFSERLRSWKTLSKQLIAYYEEIRHQEVASAKGYARAAAIVRPPWRQSNAFRPGTLTENNNNSGGGTIADKPVAEATTVEATDTAEASSAPTAIADLIHTLYVAAKEASEQRERSARAITDQTIKELNRLRLECKRRGREVAKELASVKQKASKAGDNTKAQLISLERACEEQRTSKFARKLGQEEKTLPTDPWLIKLEVQHSMDKQFAKENRYQQALIAYQQSLAAFEASAVQSISSTINNYNDRRLKDIEAQVTLLRNVHTTAERQDRDAESTHFFVKYAAHLPNVDTPLRSLATSSSAYPCLDDALTNTLRVGRLERKGGLLNTWKECRAILTAAGYLHCFPISSGIGSDQQTDLSQNPSPDVSIYLAHCTIGAHSVEGSPDNSFEITERAADGKGLFRKSHHRYQIRASTRDDMLAWWQELSKHAEAMLVQSTGGNSALPTSSTVATEGGESGTGTLSKRNSMFSRLGGSFGRAKGTNVAATAATADKTTSSTAQSSVPSTTPIVDAVTPEVAAATLPTATTAAPAEPTIRKWPRKQLQPHQPVKWRQPTSLLLLNRPKKPHLQQRNNDSIYHTYTLD